MYCSLDKTIINWKHQPLSSRAKTLFLHPMSQACLVANISWEMLFLHIRNAKALQITLVGKKDPTLSFVIWKPTHWKAIHNKWHHSVAYVQGTIRAWCLGMYLSRIRRDSIVQIAGSEPPELAEGAFRMSMSRPQCSLEMLHMPHFSIPLCLDQIPRDQIWNTSQPGSKTSAVVIQLIIFQK